MLNFAKNKIKSKYVIIFSDLASLMLNTKIFERTLFEVEKIVKVLIKNKNTIIIPTFNLNFPKTKKTSNDEKFITTGYLSKFLLKKFNFLRTSKPMYNYAVLGPNTKEILKLKQTTAWGKDSVLRFLSENSKTIGIGVNTSVFEFTWVTIHSCEEYLAVPYRFFKTFHGKNIITNKKVKERMFVRHLNKKEQNLKQYKILKNLVDKKKLIVKKGSHINYSVIYLKYYYLNNLKHVKKIVKKDI